MSSLSKGVHLIFISLSILEDKYSMYTKDHVCVVWKYAN